MNNSHWLTDYDPSNEEFWNKKAKKSPGKPLQLPLRHSSFLSQRGSYTALSLSNFHISVLNFQTINSSGWQQCPDWQADF